MIIEHASHSRLNLFEQCNYKYKLKYHDKIKIVEYKDYLEFGSYIHYVFEHYIKNKLSLKEASELAIKQFNKFGNDYKKNIPTIFRHFEEFNKNIYSSEISKEDVELEFNIDISGFIFNGKIDRNIKYTNEKFLIVDYKSTATRNELNKTEAKSDGQLAKYVYMIHKLYDVPIKNIWGMLFYVLSGNKILVSFTEEEVMNHIEESVEIAKKIYSMPPELAKPKITALCSHCEYRNVCQPYQKFLTIKESATR